MNINDLNISELTTLPLFDGIRENDLASLIRCLGGFVHEFGRDNIIYLDEDQVTHVCVVLSGIVHMLKEDENGHVSLLTYMQPGELFGESFALRRLPNSKVTFLAARRTLILYLPLNKVMHSCSSACSFHERLISNMYDLLSLKNIALMQKIDIVSKDSMRDKILCYLRLQLIGKTENGASRGNQIQGNTITLPLNKAELAHYLGVNRSSLCRELGSMEQEGLLRIQGNTYTLL